jgi:hypothetical protein
MKERNPDRSDAEEKFWPFIVNPDHTVSIEYCSEDLEKLRFLRTILRALPREELLSLLDKAIENIELEGGTPPRPN